MKWCGHAVNTSMGIIGCWPILRWLGRTQGGQALVVRGISFWLHLLITVSVHVATSVGKVHPFPVQDIPQNM